jgi:hypothetical protein
MSYGHAHELLNGKKSPAAELRVATRKLKLWADVNPGLRTLYLDFEACLRDLDAHLAGTEPDFSVKLYGRSTRPPEAT